MREWNEGDRVRCVKREEDDPVQIGDVGTVLEDSDVPYVKWDVERKGMNSDARWAMMGSELVEE